MTLNSKAYVSQCGQACPSCEKHNITSEGYLETDDITAWGKVSCEDCGATWTEYYTLQGFDDLHNC